MTAVGPSSPALLALEDGTIFRGMGFGGLATATGEVCFNTALTGYQEVLTDPSYESQIVAMTSAQIGNTGINREDHQSARPHVAALCVRELSSTTSSWRADAPLGEWLLGHGIPCMSGVDTRRLTRHVRRAGAMRGALSTEVTHADELIDIARSSPGYEGRDLVDVVSTARPYAWEPEDAAARRPVLHGPRRPPASSRHLRLGRRAKVAAFDYGIKRSMLDLLVAHGCDVTVLPATTEADSVVAGRFDGVFLSNGPGDPEPVDYAVRTIRRLLGRVPLFGVCLGHQLLARALGATTYKLPFGHRGANHPVRMVGSQRVEITSQNHGFAVDTGSLERTAAALTHINLNDSTVEGIEVPGVAFAVQYHPEASPGPHDSRYLFDRFIDLIATFDAPRAVAPEAP